jgi:hypothetical protein
MRISALLLIILFGINISDAQEIDAEELISKSIKFHDPKGKWASFQHTLNLNQDNPQKETRKRIVYLDRLANTFSFEGAYATGKLEYKVINDLGKATWNGSESIPDSIRTKYRISDERAVMYRNYYSYLYGMPMKLMDPGTIVHPQVEAVEFHGGDYYKIKVTYEESVGTDNWYFYFKKDNYALGAYEFWKKTPGDGEYLLLEGTKEIGGVKLPRIIKWFVTADDRWLGSDIIE